MSLNDNQAQAAPADDIHSCSYYCDRPACIRAQRDELRDRLEAQAAPAVDRLPGELGNAFLAAQPIAEQVRALEAEVEALRPDAERYRWLRGDAPEHSERWMRWDLKRWDGKSWSSLERYALDAAIDAALRGKESTP